jgi:hypothetical protein
MVDVEDLHGVPLKKFTALDLVSPVKTKSHHVISIRFIEPEADLHRQVFYRAERLLDLWAIP